MTKTEKTISILLFIVWMFTAITFIQKKSIYVTLDFAVPYLIVICLMYLIIRFITVKRFGRIKKSVLIVCCLLLSFVLIETLLGITRKLYRYDKYFQVFSFRDSIFNDNYSKNSHFTISRSMIIPAAVSIIYGQIRIKHEQSKIFGRLTFILIAVLLTIFTSHIVGDNYIDSNNFNYTVEIDDKKVTLCQDKRMENISEFSHIFKLYHKPNYVLFWTNSCNNLPPLISPEKAKNDSVFSKVNRIYVNGEINYIKNNREFWKLQIKNNKLTGKHIYLCKQDFENIFVDDLKIKTGTIGIHSVLFDKNWSVIDGSAIKADSVSPGKIIKYITKI